MSQACKFLQLSLAFCEAYVPKAILNSLQTQRIENPLRIPTYGLNISQDEPQVLDWTPTTDGTVSLDISAAPVVASWS